MQEKAKTIFIGPEFPGKNGDLRVMGHFGSADNFNKKQPVNPVNQGSDKIFYQLLTVEKGDHQNLFERINSENRMT
jgi:hypothetical protein